LFGRAGGLVHVGFDRPFKKDRTEAEKANDVLLAGWDSPPGEGELKKIGGFRDRGCYVVGFGPKGEPDASPAVALCDAFFDTATGADDRVVALPGGGRAGHCNHLVNAASGWVFCGELVAALTRHGKMPAMWKSYGYADGPEWGDRLLGKKQFHDEYRVPPIAAGQLGRQYLDRARYHLRRFQRTQLAEVSRAADLIAGQVRQGSKVIVASTGHMPPCFIGRREDAAWAKNVEANDNLPSQVKSFDAASADGALVLRLGYFGLHKDLAELMNRRQQRVILVTSENPRPEFSHSPKGMVARIDTGCAFGDACVTIDDYPLRVLPPSGVMQVVAYETIDVEVLTRLATGPR
jgi:hypothetical protein